MEEGPKPIILTVDPEIPMQAVGEKDGDPGKDSFVIGFVLIICSIIMFATLDEFCCLMGLLVLVGGFVFLGSGFQKTRNWRRENNIKKWTIGEILLVLMMCVVSIPVGLGILEIILWEFF